MKNKKIVLTFAIVLAASSLFAQKSIFKLLISDKPNAQKAILAVSSNCFIDLKIAKGQTVYSTPEGGSKYYVMETGKNRANVAKFVNYYYVDPDDYRFSEFHARVATGLYPHYAGAYIRFFPFTSTFRLEAGKVYYFGHINVHVPTNEENGRREINFDVEHTCNVEMNPEILEAFKVKFKKDCPKIYNSVNGNIEQVVFHH